MSLVEQVSRLLPFSEQKANFNTYLGLTALTGAIGWGVTAYVLHVQTSPPSGTVSLVEAGQWVAKVDPYRWQLIGLWTVLIAALLVVAVFRIERGGLMTIPNLVWILGIGVAMVLNVASVQIAFPVISAIPGAQTRIPVLTWLPWLVLFTVGYSITGLLVERGWIYFSAAAVSGLLTVYSLFAWVTSTGALVVSPEADAPIAGAVLFPFPYTYFVLGALHVLPVAIDAAMGGRELNEEGVSRLQEERMAEGGDTSGGVVPD